MTKDCDGMEIKSPCTICGGYNTDSGYDEHGEWHLYCHDCDISIC